MIAEREFRQQTKSGSGVDTTWSQYRKWFIEEAKQEAALRRGEPKGLDKTVALTVDLCWSLRAYADNLLNAHIINEVIPAPEFGGSFVSPGDADKAKSLELAPFTGKSWAL